MDAETLRIFNAVHLGHPAASRIIPIVRSEVSRALAGCRQPDNTGACLLADLGNYIIQIIDILSQIASALAFGNYIPDYTREKAIELASEHDLRTTDYLDEKHVALKRVAYKWFPTCASRLTC